MELKDYFFKESEIMEMGVMFGVFIVIVIGSMILNNPSHILI